MEIRTALPALYLGEAGRGHKVQASRAVKQTIGSIVLHAKTVLGYGIVTVSRCDPDSG